MAEFALKYADARGEIHNQVAEAASEQELRDRMTQQGFLVYSVKPRGQMAALGALIRRAGKKLNIEKFLIFNQQFVTLIKAGLPILKGLDLLADRLTDPKLGPYIKAVSRRRAARLPAVGRVREAGDLSRRCTSLRCSPAKRAARWPRCWSGSSPTSAPRSRSGKRSWFR